MDVSPVRLEHSLERDSEEVNPGAGGRVARAVEVLATVEGNLEGSARRANMDAPAGAGYDGSRAKREKGPSRTAAMRLLESGTPNRRSISVGLTQRPSFGRKKWSP